MLQAAPPTSVIPFAFEGAAVRAVLIDDEPHLVGNDVAERLGYTNPSKAMGDHCKGVTKRYPLQTPGGMQQMRVLAEPDVLRLIIRSKLPAAERFERWVFEEVLPSIRKTGRYGSPDLNDPAAMRSLLLGYTEKVLALQAEIAVNAPKAEALDRLSRSEGSLCITDAAKTLQVPPRDLFRFLRADGWIYTRPGGSSEIAYQARINAGLMEHKTTTVTRSDGTEKTVTQVRVTPKGLATLAVAMKPAAPAAPELPLISQAGDQA